MLPWQYRTMQIPPSPSPAKHTQHPGTPQHGCISAAIAVVGCCTAPSARMANIPNSRVKVQRFCLIDVISSVRKVGVRPYRELSSRKGLGTRRKVTGSSRSATLRPHLVGSRVVMVSGIPQGGVSPSRWRSDLTGLRPCGTSRNVPGL